jgi:simple sugar transport system ATP-binding protein
VVLVTHKIDEVLGVADHVTVLREGRTVLSAEREAVDGPGLVAAMVGRSEARTGAVVPVGAAGPRGRGAGKAAEPGTEPLATGVAEPVASEVAEPVATLERATVRGAGRRPALEGVSLSVRRGQILGVAGVEGNGQRELALVLAGRRAPDTGVARLPAGIGFIPQDRTREGLIGDFDLVENVALALHADERFARGPLLLWGELRARAETLRARFAIRAPSVDVRARTLSGGNQQRLVVGRELALAADLLVADNPTRGLDVAATAVVHEELFRLARSPGGPGVVLVSTDLDEVLALADRVVVMSRGRLLIPESGVPTREELGALMLGGRRELE